MKILLVTRGSQGDIYPYIRLAIELKNRGHFITLSIPQLFKQFADDAEINYVLQASDDILGLLEETPDTNNLLEWMKRVVDSQFKELIPLLQEHDILVAANTEFAAVHIAEYCRKPCIRTAFAPLMPSKAFPPAVFKIVKPHPVSSAVLWFLINSGMNLMFLKTINKNRKAYGMKPIKDQADYAPSHAHNYFMYSKYLGVIDNNWKYKWDIGGYCFNDKLHYEKEYLDDIINFIKKDSRPTVYFSLGSCNVAQRDRFTELLYEICRERNYKLLISAGWWNAGKDLHDNENLFHMDKIIPHCLVFPHCDAIIHHGGSGTTHSATRSGRPQLVAPILMDQFFWGYRTKILGVGPGTVKIKGVSKKHLASKVDDLLNNPAYKEKAQVVGDLVRNEKGVENFCKYIESHQIIEMPENNNVETA